MSSALTELQLPARGTARKIVLVGNPNVGKSVIFRLLTGSYVMVSNFPGTTVEISRGRLQLGGVHYEVVDTPGIYSCVPQSEDEKVTCEILLREAPDLVIQVADAKNLRRTLLITSQLVEFGFPIVLVLNMMDEAEERGIAIDVNGLAELFAAPVVETVAIYSRGRKKLLQAIQEARRPVNPLRLTELLPRTGGSGGGWEEGIPGRTRRGVAGARRPEFHAAGGGVAGGASGRRVAGGLRRAQGDAPPVASG